MATRYRSLILFLLSALTCSAQPFLQSELAYGNVAVTTNAPCYTESVVTNGAVSELTPSHNYEGFAFTASSNMTVTALGRWVVPGNTNTHDLVLYAQLDTSNALASATLITAGASTSQFVYTNVTPVVITSGSRYYVLSHEIDIATVRDTAYGSVAVSPLIGITTIGDASITADIPSDAGSNGNDGGTSFKILGCP